MNTHTDTCAHTHVSTHTQNHAHTHTQVNKDKCKLLSWKDGKHGHSRFENKTSPWKKRERGPFKIKYLHTMHFFMRAPRPSLGGVVVSENTQELTCRMSNPLSLLLTLSKMTHK